MTAGRVWIAAVLAVCLLGPSARAASPYVVGNYPVEAAAADAVSAKAQGLAEAQKGALRYLLKRLVDVSAYRQLPTLAPAAVEAMIESVSVRSEQNSPTEYVATLDFGFRAGAVRQLMQKAGLPFIDKQAPLLTVIPVYAAPAASGAVAVSPTEGQRIWRQAWIGLDLGHALTPIKLAVAGPSSTNENFLKLAAGDRSKLGIVQAESSADKLLLAIASPSPDGRKLNVTLIGEDWTGALDLHRTYSLYYNDTSYTAEFAAVIALGVLEGRWKKSQGLASTADGSEELTWTTTAASGSTAALQSVRLTAQFASLQEWQLMRSRLGQIAGPQNLQVGALSARGAEVQVAYPGGASALQQRLADEGLALSDAGGRLVLRPAN
jgi:hypothetical protein